MPERFQSGTLKVFVALGSLLVIARGKFGGFPKCDDQRDVIKLHKASGKATFLVYDDFEGKALPELRQRIKVNLRTRWVQVFDHSAEGQLLYFKERFVGPNHPRRVEMQKFSGKLRKLGVVETMAVLPSKADLQNLIARAGLNENLNLKRRTQATAPSD